MTGACPAGASRHHDLSGGWRLAAIVALKITGTAAMSATALAVTAAPAASAAADRSPSPYCVDRGGFDGPGSTTRDCRYADYESCLQAAAARGNCVRNIAAGREPPPPAAMKKRGRP